MRVRLMRIRYDTDADNSPSYEGAFSQPFPDPKVTGRQIVGVDWSTPGEVEVTYLVPVL